VKLRSIGGSVADRFKLTDKDYPFEVLVRSWQLTYASLTCGLSQTTPQDCREQYREELEANAKSSSVHFRLAECFLQRKNRVMALNEFREALRGDLQPPWTVVWSHVKMGKILDRTGQRERALNEYRLAEETKDKHARGAGQSAKYRQSPYNEN
jgi:hypothetical protein